MDSKQYKLRIKFNSNPKLGPADQYFLTDQIDSEKDVVFEENGYGVVVDKDTLSAIDNCMLDYITDLDNIARSSFCITKKRDWE